MNNHVLVWDLETIPDLQCVARVHGCPEGDDEAARQALGDKFPKLYLHKIACIGALIAERCEGVWHVLSLGAPHMGERSEASSRGSARVRVVLGRRVAHVLGLRSSEVSLRRQDQKVTAWRH
ncbi:MAG: 3-5 exonuclease [Bradyrhizobium sp.]|jgi:hypothetical protein|nr:3-5 exonuclease [Bradyrhizobium sp.]